MMLRRTSLVRLLHLGPAFKAVVHVNSIVARNPDEGLLLGLREPDATCDDNGAGARRCLLMAILGHSATSYLSPHCGPKRTQDGGGYQPRFLGQVPRRVFTH